jgi:hypothetical protein
LSRLVESDAPRRTACAYGLAPNFIDRYENMRKAELIREREALEARHKLESDDLARAAES